MQCERHKRHMEACLMVQCLLGPRFVRVWDDDDEALQPEWEIDPKDLQVLEKVGHFVGCIGNCLASLARRLQGEWVTLLENPIEIVVAWPDHLGARRRLERASLAQSTRPSGMAPLLLSRSCADPTQLPWGTSGYCLIPTCLQLHHP